jgi:hypothetical protein
MFENPITVFIFLDFDLTISDNTTKIKKNIIKIILIYIIMKYLKYFETYQEYSEFQPLWDKLLSIGGIRIDNRYEEDYDKLMKRGELFNSKVNLVEMSSSKCHRNCADYWKDSNEFSGYMSYQIATGWALHGDTWEQHSWIYDYDYNVIIETTMQRDVYFGYVLNDVETAEFVFDNN